MDYKVITYYDEIRKNYLTDLHRNINTSIKNKAMLSLKYDDLNFWVTLVQVSIIFISTGLTVMNSIKSYYNVTSQAIDVTSIVMTALIGLIMAVYRFYKMDERKESLCNLRDNYTGIINKFKKVIHKMDKYVIQNDNIDDWNQVVSNYQDEVIDSYLQISETFETIFDYQDVIHYKNKFKKLFLQHEIINNEIDTVHYFKKEPMSQYQTNAQDGTMNENTTLFCPHKKTKHLNFDEFVGNYENKYLNVIKHQESIKQRNQDLYYHIMLGENRAVKSKDEAAEDDTISLKDGDSAVSKGKVQEDLEAQKNKDVDTTPVNQPTREITVSNPDIVVKDNTSDTKNKETNKNKNPLNLTIQMPDNNSKNTSGNSIVHVL